MSTCNYILKPGHLKYNFKFRLGRKELNRIALGFLQGKDFSVLKKAQRQKRGGVFYCNNAK